VQNSPAQCNPLGAFALAGYGKPTVALPRLAQFKTVQFKMRLVGKSRILASGRQDIARFRQL
jgi:hypothetical protein